MSIFNLNLLFFDYIVLVLSIVIILFSFWKGFINSILGLLTWVGSVFITIYTYEHLSQYLSNLLIQINFLSNFEQTVNILALIFAIPIIFLISLFILKRIRKALSSDLDKQILGIILDKFFGAIYGFIFVYALWSTIIFLTNKNDFEILNNFNIFLIENSSILDQISQYNQNIIQIYNSEKID